MPENPSPQDAELVGLPPLLEAVAFAARAHRHQFRKDGTTPYASHVFRVTLILRDVLGVSDRRVLTAAVLHDTIEDTSVDFDELADRFGPDIAGWVGTLSKDTRQPEAPREAAYMAGLVAAPWPVQLIKLADILDNLLDAAHLPEPRRAKTQQRAQEILRALRPSLPAEWLCAWRIVARQAGLPTEPA